MALYRCGGATLTTEGVQLSSGSDISTYDYIVISVACGGYHSGVIYSCSASVAIDGSTNIGKGVSQSFSGDAGTWEQHSYATKLVDNRSHAYSTIKISTSSGKGWASATAYGIKISE